MVPLALNTQPPEKLDLRADGGLDVHSVWYTIQGEGPLAGSPAVFVRLAGCSLRCDLCDTDYTSVRRWCSPADLLAWLDVVACKVSAEANLVVVTGGEPFRQNLGPLCLALLEDGYRVQIETNGVHPPSPDLPLSDDGGPTIEIVCSPKTPKVHPELARWASAWKYVLSADAVDPYDGLPTDVLGTGLRPARPSLGGSLDRSPIEPDEIYVQPLDVGDPEENKRHQAAAVASCLKYGYRLSLQLHKIVGLD